MVNSLNKYRAVGVTNVRAFFAKKFPDDPDVVEAFIRVVAPYDVVPGRNSLGFLKNVMAMLNRYPAANEDALVARLAKMFTAASADDLLLIAEQRVFRTVGTQEAFKPINSDLASKITAILGPRIPEWFLPLVVQAFRTQVQPNTRARVVLGVIRAASIVQDRLLQQDVYETLLGFSSALQQTDVEGGWLFPGD